MEMCEVFKLLLSYYIYCFLYISPYGIFTILFVCLLNLVFII